MHLADRARWSWQGNMPSGASRPPCLTGHSSLSRGHGLSSVSTRISQACLLSSDEGGRMTIARWSMETGGGWLIVAGLLGLLGLARPLDAAQFACGAGDVACLISAIHA